MSKFDTVDIEQASWDVSFQEGDYEVETLTFYFRKEKDPEQFDASLSLEIRDKNGNGLHMSIPRELAGRICKKLESELAREENHDN